MDISSVIVGGAGTAAVLCGGFLVRARIMPQNKITKTQERPLAPSEYLSDKTDSLSEAQIELLKREAFDEGRLSERSEVNRNLQQLHKTEIELESLKARNAGYKDGYENALSCYRVDVQPFFSKDKKGVLGFKKYRYSYGYNYQFFVNDLPCLEPFERVIGTEVDIELNSDELEKRVHNLTESIFSGAAAGLTSGFNVKKLIEKK